jgi:4-amino-4-deoxy-L-arabinose transferase-like glycosyltransferase
MQPRTSSWATRRLAGLRAGAARAGAIPRPLAVLLVLAAIHVVAWAMVLPPFQGPDEDAHFAYTQQLAETGSTPAESGGNGKNRSTEQDEAMRWGNLFSLRGVLDARPAWSDAETRTWDEVEADLPGSASADGEGPNAVAQNPPLYYALEAVPYHVAPGGSFFNRVYVMRLASAVFYLGTVALMWLIASELFPQLWARTLATALVALQPKLAMLAGTINPDVLLVLTWTAFIYAGIRILRHGPTARRLVGAGAITALAALTHGRGLPMAGALVALLLITYIHGRYTAREAVRGALFSLGALAVGLALLGLFKLVGGSGGGTYGGALTGFEGGRAFNVREFLSYVWQFYLPKPGFLEPAIGPAGYGFGEVYVNTFWSNFSWLEVSFPRFVLDLLHAGTILVLFGLYTVAVARFDAVKRNWRLIVFLVLTGAALVVAVHVTSYRNMLINPGDPLITGRYLLPLISIGAIAVTTLVTALPRRLAALATGGLVACLVVLQLSALGITLVRFYA